MEIRVFWTENAKKELITIFNFYSKKASRKVARNLIKEIVAETLLLSKFPEIGKKEELLTNGSIDYKYLVNNNYKIIYFKNQLKKRIEIVDIFDTRQNPVKLKRVLE